MSIKNELNNLKNADIYSLLLFTLFQCRNTNEYSALSELAYLLDEKNLLNLLEYYGGMTITIPKIEDLELLLCGLSVYKAVNIDKGSLEEVLSTYMSHTFSLEDIQRAYTHIVGVMTNYSFGEL
jgi:hypothetical protein